MSGATATKVLLLETQSKKGEGEGEGRQTEGPKKSEEHNKEGESERRDILTPFYVSEHLTFREANKS